jgi:hypothetical protein
MPGLAIALIASVLAGCQSQGAHSGHTTASGTAVKNSGNYSLTVSPTRFTAGQKVQVTLTISGPMSYRFGCSYPLQIDVLDSRNNVVWSDRNRPYPCNVGEAGPPVGWAHLAAGETTTFHDAWPSSGQLSAGTYSVLTSFLLATDQRNQPRQLPAVQVTEGSR